MAFTETMAAWRDKLKLGSHHRIERFGIVTTIFAATLAVLVPATAVSAYQSSRDDLSNTALYTPEFVSSISETTGNVEGVYVSEDGTRSMLLMHVDDEQAAFSTNAENYETFVTGTSPRMRAEDLETNINGNVVVFGSTGYLGVVLSSDEPFPEQIINIVVRNNSDAAVGAGDGEDAVGGDETFSEHDQWRLFFNPGAGGAAELNALAGRGVDVEALYYEVVLREQEIFARAELDEQLASMQGQLATISELESELERTNVDGVRIVPPEIPSTVAGDVVTGDLGDVFDPEADPLQEGVSEDSEVVDDGLGGQQRPSSLSEQYPDSTLELQTNEVEDAGFEFDWREDSILDGYLDELVPAGETYASFMENKADGVASGETPETDEQGDPLAIEEEDDAFDVADIEWELTDGTDLTESGEISAGMEPLVELMENLSGAYQDYYDMKQEYQVDLHTQLLELEVELINVESSYSINTNDDAVQPY